MRLFPPTLEEMRAEAEREVAMRWRVYPNSGPGLTPKRQRQIEVMEAIVDTLRQLEADEAAAATEGDADSAGAGS